MVQRLVQQRSWCAHPQRRAIWNTGILLSLWLLSISQSAAKPNVVLFFVDDMGWTDWQASEAQPHGSPLYETPNMLALANSGVTLANAYASAPVCSPTRASLMTGKNPAKTRVTEWIGAGNSTGKNIRSPINWTKNLPMTEITLAEAMQSGGYDTAFFGKWHLGQHGNADTTPLTHGYNSNIGGTFAGNPGFAGGFFAGTDGAWIGMPGLDAPQLYPSHQYLSDALAEKAAEYITQSQQREKVKPFFLTMSHYLVHTPLQAPEKLVSKYNKKIVELRGQGIDLKGHDDATYAAMVEKMDQALGMLMQRLDDPNYDGSNDGSIRDNTIIIFTSDHGGLDTSADAPTDNAPLREGKGSLYEGGTRVPFLVSWPGNDKIAPGSTSVAQTVTHDIYPTLLDMTGVAGDEIQNTAMDGVSVRAALEGETFDRGPIYWHYPHISPQDYGSEEMNGGSFVSSIIEGDWKLIYFYDEPHYELYNLATDLSETRNVLHANPDIANSLSQALRNYLIESNAQLPVSIGTEKSVDMPPVLASEQLPRQPDKYRSNQDLRDWAALNTHFNGVSAAATSHELIER